MYKIDYRLDDTNRYIPEIAYEPMKRFRKKHASFFAAYRQLSIETDARIGRKPIKKSEQRLVCRICGRRFPEVNFIPRKVISSTVGKKMLLTDEECDRCYERQKEHETSLLNYVSCKFDITLKPKTISAKLRKTDAAWRQARDHYLTKASTLQVGVAEIEKDVVPVCFDVARRVGEITGIRVRKESYVPQHLYLYLLRIALLVHPSQAIDLPYLCQDFLTGQFDLAAAPANLLDVHIWRYPIAFNYPVAVLYERQHAGNTPGLIFNLAVQNLSFQIAIPTTAKELNGQCQNNLILPPMFRDQYATHFGTPKYHLESCSSPERTQHEEIYYSLKKVKSSFLSSANKKSDK